MVKKNPPANVGDARNVGSGPASGKSPSPAVESGNPLQYSCLENSMHRGALSSGCDYPIFTE